MAYSFPVVKGVYHFFSVYYRISVDSLLVSPLDEFGQPLYPGYVNIPQADRAMSSLCSRLANSEEYFNNLAEAIGLTPKEFRDGWNLKAGIINNVNIGGWRHIIGRSVRVPESLDIK